MFFAAIGWAALAQVLAGNIVLSIATGWAAFWTAVTLGWVSSVA